MAKTDVSVVSLVFLATAICACGGGSGGGGGGGAGSCNMNPTCGGTLDGTWQMDTTCAEGDVAQMMAGQLSLPAACNGLFQTATLSLTGTAKFANGMETDNLTMTTDAKVLYTPACVGAISRTTVTLTADICTTMQSNLLKNGTFSSASCAFTGGNCACSVSNQQQSPGTPVAYTVSGGTISYTDGSSPMNYCVQGTTLTARQLDSGLTLFNTAHKL
jgi:hypothetical protein